MRPSLIIIIITALGLALAGCWPAQAEVHATSQTVIESYAIVQDDGSLRVQGRKIRLFGIHIPDAGRRCRTVIRPPRCAPRAALALDREIQGFVRCVVQERYRDGSLAAFCFARARSSLDPPVDLGAWLIEEGLAVAGPYAPFEYTVLEKIARSRGQGIWGFFADEIRPRR